MTGKPLHFGISITSADKDKIVGEMQADERHLNAFGILPGGALMAFQIRGLDGTRRWAGGTLRSGDGVLQVFAPADVDFRAGRRWTSPRTGIAYPVQWSVRAGGHEFTLQPLLDDQENDTRLSTGAIYWEGAVRAYEQRRLVGRGYLELTGYGERLRLR